MKTICFIILLCLVSITVLSAQNYNRVALVIGNASYERCPLRNPLNDAEDVSAKLQSLGFTVIVAKDCKTRKEMRIKLEEFCSISSNAEAGVFYYSGHGMQLTYSGENYLIPTQAEMTSEEDVSEECIRLNHVLNKMDESGVKMKIAIIDACRDNPFRTWYRSSACKGLSTSIKTPSGTFIAFATSANDVAADGNERNSPFTSAFLKSLDGDNLEINYLFTVVKRIVNETTKGNQRPWTSNDLTSLFYFSNNRHSSEITTHSIQCFSCEGEGCLECNGNGTINYDEAKKIYNEAKRYNQKLTVKVSELEKIIEYNNSKKELLVNKSPQFNFGDNQSIPKL